MTTIVAVQMFHIPPQQVDCTERVAARVPSDECPRKKGMHYLVKFSTGWIISGVFLGRSGVSDFHAYHPQFGHEGFVKGDYEGHGVYSPSREALERFLEDHPPHRSSNLGV